MLVLDGTDERSKGFGTDLTVLTKFVGIHFIRQKLSKRLGIALQAIEANEDLVCHLIYLFEIAVHCLELGS